MGGDRYTVATLAANGCIYAPPCGANRVLEIDPSRSIVRVVGPAIEGIPEVDNGGDKYQAMVAALNGNLYAVPYNSSRFLQICPAPVRVTPPAVEKKSAN